MVYGVLVFIVLLTPTSGVFSSTSASSTSVPSTYPTSGAHYDAIGRPGNRFSVDLVSFDFFGWPSLDPYDFHRKCIVAGASSQEVENPAHYKHSGARGIPQGFFAKATKGGKAVIAFLQISHQEKSE